MLNTAEKKNRKMQQEQDSGKKKIMKNISQCNLLSVPPQCPRLGCHTPHATGKCGVKRQSTAVAASRNTGGDRESVCGVCGATCEGSRSSLVPLVPSTDQTAHCTVLHWPSVFFSSVHVRRTSTGTHIHLDGAGLQSPHQMSAHMRGSLYSTPMSSSITTCFRRHSCLAVQSLLERTILGSCARGHVLPLDHG